MQFLIIQKSQCNWYQT